MRELVRPRCVLKPRQADPDSRRFCSGMRHVSRPALAASLESWETEHSRLRALAPATGRAAVVLVRNCGCAMRGGPDVCSGRRWDDRACSNGACAWSRWTGGGRCRGFLVDSCWNPGWFPGLRWCCRGGWRSAHGQVAVGRFVALCSGCRCRAMGSWLRGRRRMGGTRSRFGRSAATCIRICLPHRFGRTTTAAAFPARPARLGWPYLPRWVCRFVSGTPIGFRTRTRIGCRSTGG